MLNRTDLLDLDLDRLRYQVVLFAITLGFTLDLLFGRWTRATVTGLVVDLGELAEIGTLRDRSLVVER